MNQEVNHNGSKVTIKFNDVFCGGHEVDGDGVHYGSFCCIEDESVLPSLFDKVVLQHKE